MAGLEGLGEHIQRDAVALTASYVLKLTDAGRDFTNRGAGGAITLTLPAPSFEWEGFHFHVFAVAAQNIIVATATADTLIVLNDATADSLALQTTNEIIGGVIGVYCDGTSWFAWGEAVGHTYTIVTA